MRENITYTTLSLKNRYTIDSICLNGTRNQAAIIRRPCGNQPSLCFPTLRYIQVYYTCSYFRSIVRIFRLLRNQRLATIMHACRVIQWRAFDWEIDESSPSALNCHLPGCTYLYECFMECVALCYVVKAIYFRTLKF